MDYVLLFFAIVLIVVGLVGCVVPILPGPPISYGGMILLHITEKWHFSSQLLIILAFVTVIITIVDYIVPIWGTKKFGGSKAGIRGSTIGLILGLFFFPPIGLIIGPFVGAVIGESIAGKDASTAFRSGLGSFIGFLMGTGMKLANAAVITFYFFREIF
jgi:hypothetical protein